MAKIRKDFPNYSIAILHVKADAAVVLHRAEKRALTTGRHVPKEEILKSVQEVPASVQLLVPLVDFTVHIDNSSDGDPVLEMMECNDGRGQGADAAAVDAGEAKGDSGPSCAGGSGGGGGGGPSSTSSTSSTSTSSSSEAFASKAGADTDAGAGDDSPSAAAGDKRSWAEIARRFATNAQLSTDHESFSRKLLATILSPDDDDDKVRREARTLGIAAGLSPPKAPKVVLFSKTYCTYCHRVKAILDHLLPGGQPVRFAASGQDATEAMHERSLRAGRAGRSGHAAANSLLRRPSRAREESFPPSGLSAQSAGTAVHGGAEAGRRGADRLYTVWELDQMWNGLAVQVC